MKQNKKPLLIYRNTKLDKTAMFKQYTAFYFNEFADWFDSLQQ